MNDAQNTQPAAEAVEAPTTAEVVEILTSIVEQVEKLVASLAVDAEETEAAAPKKSASALADEIRN